MNTKQYFKCKPTQITNAETGETFSYFSDSIAENILALARMSNDPTYSAPCDGYDKDSLEIAKWIKTLSKEKIRHYDRNVILFYKKEAEN